MLQGNLRAGAHLEILFVVIIFRLSPGPSQYSPSVPRKCLDGKSLLYKFIYTPAILHIHVLFTNPNPVFRLQL